MSQLKNFVWVLVLGSLATGVVVFLARDPLEPMRGEGTTRQLDDAAQQQRHILQMQEAKWHTSKTNIEQNSEQTDGQPKRTAIMTVSAVDLGNRVNLINASTKPSLLHPPGEDVFKPLPGKAADLSVQSILRNGQNDSTIETVNNGKPPSLTQTKDIVEGAPHCSTPRKNVLFLKTHKTGSSTVQNILYRYGDRNGLTFALPVSDVYMGTPYLFQRRYAMKSSTGKYNMLANHARYSRPEMQKVMYEGAVFITILRHPSTQFESMFDYYGFKGRFQTGLAGFASDPRRYYNREGSRPMHSSLNPSLYDLGVSKPDLSNLGVIRTKINALEEEFNLVLISEYLPESLVLLKDLMCWGFEDITYFSANARTKSQVDRVSEKTLELLYKWNQGDALLYEHFNRTLWRKIGAYGHDRMANDVRTLEKMNEALAERCLGGTKKEKSVKSVVSRYVLRASAANDDRCVRMVRPAVEYLGRLKKKQKEKGWLDRLSPK